LFIPYLAPLLMSHVGESNDELEGMWEGNGHGLIGGFVLEFTWTYLRAL
jgi:hypothetical protein